MLFNKGLALALIGMVTIAVALPSPLNVDGVGKRDPDTNGATQAGITESATKLAHALDSVNPLSNLIPSSQT